MKHVAAIGRSGLHQDISRCLACEPRRFNECGVLAAGELKYMAAIAKFDACLAGKTLFSEGEAADRVYNLTKGLVRLSRTLANGQRQLIGFRFSGDFIGFGEDKVFAYSAEAVTPVQVCRFARKDFDSLLCDHPKLQGRLLEMATSELMAAHEQISIVGKKPAMEKVAQFLMMMSRLEQRRGNPGNPVNLLMSRADIGDFLGIAFETVSRCLTRFDRLGLIAVESPRVVRVNDFEGLRDYSDET